MVLALGLAFVSAAPVRAQELTVTCTVASPTATASPVEFGLIPGALVGIDPLDEPLPPAAPGQDLQVYLQMMTPPETLPNRWRKDARPPSGLAANHVELWVMVVESAAVGQELGFSVAMTVSELLPATLRLIGPGGVDRLVSPSDSFQVPCTAPITQLFWELQIDEQVEARPASWGLLQATYR